MSVTFAEEIDEVKAEVVKGDTKNWLTLAYSGNNALALAGSGSGGLDECTATFDKDIVIGFVRVVGTDSKGENKREKYILIMYVPDTVKGIKKARTSMHFNKVKEYFRYQHVIMQVGEAKEVTKEECIVKLNKTGGSDTSEIWIFE